VRTRSLGSLGIPCSELALGTWGLSGDAYGPVTEEEQVRVIGRARTLGITLYETADCYGVGAMERRLAEVLGVDEAVTIVTKIGTDRESSPPRKCFAFDFLAKSLDACAARLRPRSVDVVLLHNPSVQTIQRGDFVEFFTDQMYARRIKTWGISVGSKAAAEAALEVGAPVIELAYNVFWPDDLRAIEAEVKTRKTAILARSVLAHGLLAGYFSQDKLFPTYDHRSERWTSDELRRRIRHLDALRPLLRGDVSTLRSAALRWVLCHEQVSSAVLGPRNALQLDQLIRDAGREPPYLPLEILGALETRLEDLGARS
jgi:aryl-alcohol dehydrogenase-like predicted oxidoreductase